MGQKTNPIGFRLGIVKPWVSRWFASKDMPALLKEDELVRKYLLTRLGHAAIAEIHIERRPGKVTVTIHTGRPGVVIGKKGTEVDKLRDELAQLTGKEAAINVEEIKRPETSAQLVADNIAHQLQQRISFRRAMKRALQSAMRMGAQGIKVRASGRLGGAEIARTEGYHEGRVPLHTLRADIDYATSTAFGLMSLEPGWITNRQIEASRVAMTREMKRGGKVWIRIFPDKPITKKPAETRMGKGKGNPEGWVAVVKPARILFEIDGVTEDLAKKAFALASAKLPVRTRIVRRTEM